VVAHEEKMMKFIKMGNNSSILLLALIEDILDLSKMEAGTFTLTVASFQIDKLLSLAAEIFEYQWQQKRIQFIVEIDPRLKKTPCKSDHGRIKQILLNLLSNALKFTFDGYIKLTAKLVTIHKQGFVQFSVEDTGVGIKREEQKKLFKLFGMLDTNKAMNRNGWGIGLTVSKRFAEALGGKIWLESEFNKGTTIHFIVPYPDRFSIIDESKFDESERNLVVWEESSNHEEQIMRVDVHSSFKLESLTKMVWESASKNVLMKRNNILHHTSQF
jgi:signal transduction histidine kinase